MSLTIDKGEFIFLTGPSGAGKSTLLRLLLREDLPSERDLTAPGRDLKTLSAPPAQTVRRPDRVRSQDVRRIAPFPEAPAAALPRSPWRPSAGPRGCGSSGWAGCGAPPGGGGWSGRTTRAAPASSGTVGTSCGTVAKPSRGGALG